MGERIFFQNWAGLGRTLVIGVLAYAARRKSTEGRLGFEPRLQN